MLSGMFRLNEQHESRAQGYADVIAANYDKIKNLQPGQPMTREQADAVIEARKNVQLLHGTLRRAGFQRDDNPTAQRILQQYGAGSAFDNQFNVQELHNRIMGYDDDQQPIPGGGLYRQAAQVKRDDIQQRANEREAGRVSRVERKLFDSDQGGEKTLGQLGSLGEVLRNLGETAEKASNSTKGLTKAQADQVEQASTLYKKLSGQIEDARRIAGSSPEAAAFVKRWDAMGGDAQLLPCAAHCHEAAKAPCLAWQACRVRQARMRQRSCPTKRNLACSSGVAAKGRTNAPEHLPVVSLVKGWSKRHGAA